MTMRGLKADGGMAERFNAGDLKSPGQCTLARRFEPYSRRLLISVGPLSADTLSGPLATPPGVAPSDAHPQG